MANTRVLSGFVAIIAMATAGCGFERSQNTSPLSPSGGLGALTGLWTSVPSASSSSSCTDFRWSITQQSATLVSGAFSAQCGGSIAVSGTAAGTVSGSTIILQATGTATSQGFNCPFSLSGTGYVEGDSIRVPYTGQTCAGPIQGEETLRRQSLVLTDPRSSGESRSSLQEVLEWNQT